MRLSNSVLTIWHQIKAYVYFASFVLTLFQITPLDFSQITPILVENVTAIELKDILFYSSTVIFLYLAITAFAYRNTPLTILATNVDLYYEDKDGYIIQCLKEQKIRARQRNVTAYEFKITPSRRTGIVCGPSNRIEKYRPWCKLENVGKSDVPIENEGDRLEYSGSESSGITIIHRFKNELPLMWHSLWDKNSVKRSVSYYWHDSEPTKDNSYGLRSTSRMDTPQKVKICIHFLPGQEIEKYMAEIYLIHGIESASNKIKLHSEKGKVGPWLEYENKGIQNALHKVTWKLK